MFHSICKNTSTCVNVYSKEKFIEDEKLGFISKFHDTPLGGHQRVPRTFNRLYTQSLWKGMRNHIRDFIEKFSNRQKKKKK